MAPSPRDRKAPWPLPLLGRSRGRAAAALVSLVSSGAPTLATIQGHDEGARARIHRGLRAAMHVLRDRERLVGVAPAMLAARRLRYRGHRIVGNHGAGGVTVTRGCARVSRRLQKSARSVRCPRKERGRGRARSEAPSRAASRQSANRHGGSCGNARAGALSGALRRWKVLLVRRLVLAVHAAGRECGVGPS